ncbi:hypothetical protein SME22J_37010 [Serratia marcescens]|nr:hypothetical protein SME22J_37010 [Serratia marcescens]
MIKKILFREKKLLCTWVEIMLRYLFFVILVFLPSSGYTMSFSASFSDWYLEGGEYYAIDVYVDRMAFEPGDPALDTNGNVVCSGYGCYFEAEGVLPQSIVSKSSGYIVPPVSGNVTRVPLDEMNKKIAKFVPWKAKLVFDKGKIPDRSLCITLELSGTLPGTKLGSTCDGTLPLPPPPPPIPVFCSIKELGNGGVIDFGLTNAQENKTASIFADIICEGDSNVSGMGRLLFSDINAQGSKDVILHNDSAGLNFKGVLSIGDDKASNEKRFEVRGGYSARYLLNVDLLSSDMKGMSGDFVGTALVTFEID